MKPQSAIQSDFDLLHRVIEARTNPAVAKRMGDGLLSRTVLVRDVLDEILNGKTSTLVGTIRECAVILDGLAKEEGEVKA